MQNLVKLTTEDAIEFNGMIHQAIIYGHNLKEKTKQMFYVWKWFINKHTTQKQNHDTSIGHAGFVFGIEFGGKDFIAQDLMNNMQACHNLFKEGGDLHVL